MASEYLAMYIEVQFVSGRVDNPIVPIRHFASSRPRLGEAVRSGEFFTDMDAALREWKLCTSGALEISVLFDSTLPGRENIIKGRAKKGMAEIADTMEAKEHAMAQIPAIQRPDVSGFTLFFGTKTSKTPYPREVDISKWRNFFTKPGAYIELSAPSFERVTRDFNGNTFTAMTFRDWSMMAIGGP
jgi:hypothetical protein